MHITEILVDMRDAGLSAKLSMVGNSCIVSLKQRTILKEEVQHVLVSNGYSPNQYSLKYCPNGIVVTAL